jgi:xanthine dehydrogenase YagS FAD-binding subunit
MKSFEYAAPKNIKEATALLSDNWGESEILAGGTDLVTCLKQQIATPKRVVSLRNISDLRGIKADSKAVRIGAMTTLEDFASNKDVQKHFPSLATAAKNIASPQILSRGSVGGDLCQRPRCWYYRNGFGLLGKNGDTSQIKEGDNRYHAIFGTDSSALFVNPSSLGPALIALGATLKAEGPNGKKREIPAAEFFSVPKSDKDREYALKANEILTEISVPISGLKNATYEIRHRQGLDWPYVTASVAYGEKNGNISDARVVLGHVAATPWLAASAGKALNNSALNEDAAAKCAEAAVEGAKPLSRNGYKVQLAKTAVKRALLAARAA